MRENDDISGEKYQSVNSISKFNYEIYLIRKLEIKVRN